MGSEMCIRDRYNTDTRFAKAIDIQNKLIEITGNSIIHTIEKAEPIGPKKMCDLLVIAPCTGNTLAKLAEERNALAQSLESLKAQTAEAASSAAKTEFELTAVRGQLREAEDEVLRRTEEHKQVQLLAAAVTENLENIEKELAHLTSRTGGEEGKLQALKAALKAHGISEDIDAFMTLAFVSLPVIPKLRLNTYGIVDVDAQRIVPAVF